MLDHRTIFEEDRDFNQGASPCSGYPIPALSTHLLWTLAGQPVRVVSGSRCCPELQHQTLQPSIEFAL